MARTTFSGPVNSVNGFEVDGTATVLPDGSAPVPLGTFTVGTLPSAAANEGSLIYVSDSATGGTAAVSNGTDWIDLIDGLAVD